MKIRKGTFLTAPMHGNVLFSIHPSSLASHHIYIDTDINIDIVKYITLKVRRLEKYDSDQVSGLTHRGNKPDMNSIPHVTTCPPASQCTFVFVETEQKISNCKIPKSKPHFIFKRQFKHFNEQPFLY